MGDLLLLWGKAERRSTPGHHPLLCHLLDAAAVGEALLPRFAPLLPLPPSWVAYLVGLHDIGKADPLFQNKEPACAQRLREAGLALPMATAPFRHEARSAEWVYAHLQEAHGWEHRAAVLASQAIAGHQPPARRHASRRSDAAAAGGRARRPPPPGLRLAVPPHTAHFAQASGAALPPASSSSPTGSLSNEGSVPPFSPAAPAQYLEAP
jgi:CRISPR-associated endonuclease Cas3-HD